MGQALRTTIDIAGVANLVMLACRSDSEITSSSEDEHCGDSQLIGTFIILFISLLTCSQYRPPTSHSLRLRPHLRNDPIQ